VSASKGGDRAFHALMVVLVMLAGAVGWLLQSHLSELDGRLDLMRDQVLRSCLRP
jgi:hypothetical protein